MLAAPSSFPRYCICILRRWRCGETARTLHGPSRRATAAVRRIFSSMNERSAPLDYDASGDLLGLEVDLQPRNAVSGPPKLRSWFGPNGQYIRELPCPSCRGRGYTPCPVCGIERSRVDCAECNGEGLKTCQKCLGDCVIWEESIDERPWEKARSSSPLKVKEDDEVDNLEIKVDSGRKSKRVYSSLSPEVGRKISRSLRVTSFCLVFHFHLFVVISPFICMMLVVYLPSILSILSLNAKTGLFSKRMKIIHRNPLLHAQRVAAIKKTKGTTAARKQASESMKAFFRDPENRLKRSIAMKGVKFHCRHCGEEGHRRHYCPELRGSSGRMQFKCRLCGERGHNRRTCGRKTGEVSNPSKKGGKRRCSNCGQVGHNRRTCSLRARSDADNSNKVGLVVISKSSRTYSCKMCSRAGHNRRTCSGKTESS
ncbi:hypothetical protein Taro_011635 [Colocasia esculenta]|uniref:CCHC-type domain-containing protein n=1 Tax=Colocasia esculenta TaxID=4460 RepID=A0A843UAP5_COLES|nr:hypothetical protein [Colocasia esculenta]